MEVGSRTCYLNQATDEEGNYRLAPCGSPDAGYNSAVILSDSMLNGWTGGNYERVSARRTVDPSASRWTCEYSTDDLEDECINLGLQGICLGIAYRRSTGGGSSCECLSEVEPLEPDSDVLSLYLLTEDSQ